MITPPKAATPHALRQSLFDSPTVLWPQPGAELSQSHLARYQRLLVLLFVVLLLDVLRVSLMRVFSPRLRAAKSLGSWMASANL
jgi:hypothetical protein